ncbi:hypothetical protein RHECNPAF_130006 [Rhizobium etli CNPAF512]|nr:hypothetical protein RHECNPAF_130006 [Rhizobium etli CNPAF512]
MASGRNRRGPFVGGQNEKACRGRRCGRLSKRTERQLGGGVLSFPQATLGGGWAPAYRRDAGGGASLRWK